MCYEQNPCNEDSIRPWQWTTICDMMQNFMDWSNSFYFLDLFFENPTPDFGKFRLERNYATQNIAFVPAMVSLAGKVHHEFLCLLWVVADMQTFKYFNLIKDEEDIRSEVRLAHSVYNRNVIDRAVACASAIRTHLPVHTCRFTHVPSSCC